MNECTPQALSHTHTLHPTACDTKDALRCPQKSDMSVAKICSTPTLPPPSPPPLVKFTTEPLNMLYTSSTTTMSAISIECSIMDSLPSGVCINFLWERDGAIINVTQSRHEEVYQVQSGALSSRLIVTNRTGGVYRCRVASQREREEGRYDVVSRAATLSVPSKWVIRFSAIRCHPQACRINYCTSCLGTRLS